MFTIENRESVIIENQRLVKGFIHRYLPEEQIEELGGFEELAADLMADYIKTVDWWIASDQSNKLSTWVYRNLFRTVLSMPSRRLVMRVPTRKLGRKSHECRRTVVGRMHYHFHGEEESSKDSSLIYEKYAVDYLAERDFHLVARDRLEKALSLLRPRDAEILRMRFFEGASYVQIGAGFGVSKQRAEQLVKKTLKRIRDSQEALIILKPVLDW